MGVTINYLIEMRSLKKQYRNDDNKMIRTKFQIYFLKSPQ